MDHTANALAFCAAMEREDHQGALEIARPYFDAKSAGDWFIFIGCVWAATRIFYPLAAASGVTALDWMHRSLLMVAQAS